MAIIKNYLMCFLLISFFTRKITSMNVIQRYLKQGKKPRVFKKTHIIFKPMKQKGTGTFSIKPQRFYTNKTPEETPYFEQFKKKLNNWYNELFYGGGTYYDPKFKDLKKKEKLYKQHQQLFNKIDFSDQETRKKAEILHKDLFDKMTETINRGGIRLASEVSDLELMAFKLYAKAENIDLKTNEAKLYEFCSNEWKSYRYDTETTTIHFFGVATENADRYSSIKNYDFGNLMYEESLLKVDKNEKITGIIDDVFNNHSIPNKYNHQDIFTGKTYKLSDENLVFAKISEYFEKLKEAALKQEGIKGESFSKEDILNAEEIPLKILSIIKSYCNGYKEPVLLEISDLDKLINLSPQLKKIKYIPYKKTLINDERSLMKTLKINGISHASYKYSFDKLKKLNEAVSVELFNVHHIDLDRIQREIDRIIEEYLKKWIVKQKQYEKEYQEREADRQASGYYQQKQQQYEEYQQRYKQSQGFENLDMTQQKALAELELHSNTTDFSLIKKAFLRLAKIHHPDQYLNDPKKQKDANEKLKRLIEAYEFLKNVFEKK